MRGNGVLIRQSELDRNTIKSDDSYVFLWGEPKFAAWFLFDKFKDFEYIKSSKR